MNILHFIYGLNVGGAETFIYNLLSNVENDTVNFDFVIQSKINDNKLLIDLINKNQFHMYQIPKFNQNILGHIMALNDILKDKHYDIIHIHMNALINIFPIILAKKNKVKIVIHSHSTQNNKGGLIGKIIHKCNKRFLRNLDTINFACGKEAGEWMFANNYIIIDNAISIDKFKYDYNKRIQLRNKNNLSNDDFIVGHVGRFVFTKNHTFIIEVFNEILKIKTNTKLFLLGDGELKKEIENKVIKYNLQEKVIFMGNVNNVNDYLSMFDLLLFPSHFEGLPFTLVEAQCTGLNILASDVVSQSVKLSNFIHFYSLNNSAKEWAKLAIKISESNTNRCVAFKQLEYTQYDAKNLASKVLNIYKEQL